MTPDYRAGLLRGAAIARERIGLWGRERASEATFIADIIEREASQPVTNDVVHTIRVSECPTCGAHRESAANCYDPFHGEASQPATVPDPRADLSWILNKPRGVTRPVPAIEVAQADPAPSTREKCGTCGHGAHQSDCQWLGEPRGGFEVECACNGTGTAGDKP